MRYLNALHAYTLSLTAIITLFAPILSSADSCGTSCGGGGSVVYTKSSTQPVLLDLLATNRSTSFSGEEARLAPIDPAIFGQGTIGVLFVKDLPAYAVAIQRLDQWQSNAPVLVPMIKRAMESMVVNAAKGCIQAPSQYELPSAFYKKNPGAKIQTSVLFMPKYGALLSTPSWNASNLGTQAGQLIHEALRQIQLSYGFDLSNANLQNITATLLKEAPGKESLESSSYLNGKLLDYILNLKSSLQEIHAFHKISCKLLQHLESIAETACEQGEANELDKLSEKIDTLSVLINELSHDMKPSEFSWERMEKLRMQSCDDEIKTIDWSDDFETELRRCRVAKNLVGSQKTLCAEILQMIPAESMAKLRNAKLEELKNNLEQQKLAGLIIQGAIIAKKYERGEKFSPTEVKEAPMAVHALRLWLEDITSHHFFTEDACKQ